MAYGAKATILLFLAALIGFHVQAGNAQGGCQLSDIVITQKNTGKVVEGQAQYRVTIENKCSCSQANVKVRCFGVHSVEPVDKSKIRPMDSELCIIVDGKPITKGSPVTFTYAAKTPQDFPVVNAKPQC
ncbi:TPD1 protein homolog 1-like [Phragmites australis]|uniref:TPD1 protein homolog 1-like n=1 Tax=Phragmites australis TaxID=29695 RepID=UPI002D773C1E|nr:TPD1 protein homolog 1-like [Phragmites australis]